jgi:menaquinone reductase, integral membrane subunit
VDKRLLVRGTERSPFWKFSLWMTVWAAVLAVGVYAAWRCLYIGLGETNMDNRFVFGLWIFLDLAIIALGAGAFFTGFLLYILRKHELKAVINSAVVLGFICYSGAVAVLAVDVGQPLRFWFTFWHPNVHSMLTEVTFCITMYLTVLAIEYVPTLLKNRQLKKIPSFLVFEWQLHKVMPVFAGIGTFLSFFHQGSLGGLFGVLRGKPFAFREGFAIWPSTFFLFVLSAAAVGPVFVLLTTWIVEKISGKQLIKQHVRDTLGRISGKLLIVYVLAKTVDTLLWINSTAPGTGTHPFYFYQWQPFGTWILLAEILLFGLVPALMLLSPKVRANLPALLWASALACGGVVLNRFVMTIQTLSLPTLPFGEFLVYVPNWNEIATFMAVIAYGVLLYSLSFRYLPLFPQERELYRS